MDQALQNVQNVNAQAQTPDQALSAAQSISGASQAQQQVSGLQGAIASTTALLSRVAPQVYGGTQNSNLSTAGATKIAADQSAPIQTNLGRQESAYQTANTDFTNKEAQAQALANGNLTRQQQNEQTAEQVYGDQAKAQEADAQNQENDLQFKEQLAQQQQEVAAEKAATSGSSKAATAAPNYNDYTVEDWKSMLQSEFKGQSWGAVSKQIEAQLGKIPTGSNLDQALHYVYTGIL